MAASTEDLKRAFADRLERVRLQQGGPSIHAFAKLCGVPYSSMRSFLEGNTLPSFESLLAIARETDTSLEYLATGGLPDRAVEVDELSKVLQAVFQDVLGSAFAQALPYSTYRQLASRAGVFYELTLRGDLSIEDVRRLNSQLDSPALLESLRERASLLPDGEESRNTLHDETED